MKHHDERQGVCSYEDFKDTIEQLQIPKKLMTEAAVQMLYEKYGGHKNFVDNIANTSITGEIPLDIANAVLREVPTNRISDFQQF